MVELDTTLLVVLFNGLCILKTEQNRTKEMVDLGVPLKECIQQEQNQIMSLFYHLNLKINTNK